MVFAERMLRLRSPETVTAQLLNRRTPNLFNIDTTVARIDSISIHDPLNALHSQMIIFTFSRNGLLLHQ